MCYTYCDNALYYNFTLTLPPVNIYIINLMILRCFKLTFDNRPIQKLLIRTQREI